MVDVPDRQVFLELFDYDNPELSIKKQAYYDVYHIKIYLKHESDHLYSDHKHNTVKQWGLYTPPHILVGLHPESSWVQMESWSPSTIFSLVATQPNISPESTWSLPGVWLPSRWTHLDWMDSTSEHRELLINPARLQMESSQINNYITIVVII